MQYLLCQLLTVWIKTNLYFWLKLTHFISHIIFSFFGLNLGAVKYWPAYTKWTDEYLNASYGNETFNMETRDDDKWNIPPSMKLHEFLSQYTQANRYLVDEVLPDMRKDVILPLCLRCEEMSSYFFVSYFWMSTGGTSSSIHIDTDENLLCVIHGHKAVLMVSPVYSTFLYSDESRVLGVSDIDPKAVDLEKYPDVMKIRYHSAMVEEGDIVYIPQMWWHQVISRQVLVSVNQTRFFCYKWCTCSPFLFLKHK